MSECLWAGAKLNRAIKMASCFLPVLWIVSARKKNYWYKKKTLSKRNKIFLFWRGRDRQHWEKNMTKLEIWINNLSPEDSVSFGKVVWSVLRNLKSENKKSSLSNISHENFNFTWFCKFVSYVSYKTVMCLIIFSCLSWPCKQADFCSKA